MSTPFIAALESEIAELEGDLESDPRYLKLRELKRLRSLYANDTGRELLYAASRAARSVSRAIASRESRNKDKVEAAAKFLEGRTVPVPTSQILENLLKQGLEINGQEPRNTLSAILSHSDLFASQGRSGWLLRSALDRKPEDAGFFGTEPKEIEQPDGSNDETPSGYQPLGASEPDEEDDLSNLA